MRVLLPAQCTCARIASIRQRDVARTDLTEPWRRLHKNYTSLLPSPISHTAMTTSQSARPAPHASGEKRVHKALRPCRNRRHERRRGSCDPRTPAKHHGVRPRVPEHARARLRLGLRGTEAVGGARGLQDPPRLVNGLLLTAQQLLEKRRQGHGNRSPHANLEN
jgi:hypothetical protein